MTARRLFVVLLAALTAMEIAVLVIRIADIRAFGSLVLFPAEGPVVYAFWRLMHGAALYEWPMRPPFTLTLYNVLFYESYARVLQVLRASDSGMLVAARFVTLACALAGAGLQYVVTRHATRQAGPRILAALLALGAWIGCGLPGWWTFSIRPDTPARVIVLLAIGATLRGFAGGSRRWLIAASGCFLGAWAFKQSEVSIFLGTCVYVAAVRRSLAELAAVAAPFAAGAAVILLAAGGAYRANVIEAPAINPWVPYLPLHWYRSVFLIDLLPWAIGGYVAIVLLWPAISSPVRTLGELSQRSCERFGVDVSYLAVSTAVSFAVATILLMKVGSALNHALELHLAASLLCAIVLSSAWPRQRALWIAAVLALVPMLVFDAALVAGREQGRTATLLQLKVWGDRLHLASAAEIASRTRLAARFTTLAVPVYCEDEVFALPWYSSGGRYPAAMIDHIYYDEAKRRRLIERGIDALLRDRDFGAVVLPDSSEFLPVAVRSGYRMTATFDRSDVMQPPLRILTRP